MRNIYRALVPGYFALLLIAACNNNEGKITEGGDTTSRKEITIDTGGIRVFTLPAPLQVATLLHLEGEPYNTQYLQPSPPPTNFASNDKRAMALGAYLVDMGYASIYDQRQIALNYAKSVQDVMDDLGITSAIKLQVAKRIEDNLNNNDSLYAIILESYGSAHNYFRDNNREETGLFIMAGGYIEGLNLLLQSERALSNNQLRNMIGQQKIFLESIIQLTDYMAHKPKVKELKSSLKELLKGFSGITVKVQDAEDGAVAVSCSISPAQLEQLTEKVAAMRKEITAA